MVISANDFTVSFFAPSIGVIRHTPSGRNVVYTEMDDMVDDIRLIEAGISTKALRAMFTSSGSDREVAADTGLFYLHIQVLLSDVGLMDASKSKISASFLDEYFGLFDCENAECPCNNI